MVRFPRSEGGSEEGRLESSIQDDVKYRRQKSDRSGRSPTGKALGQRRMAGN